MEWCFEDINVTNFSKIVLKYAIVFFLIFEYFCPSEFSDHYIITGQRRLLSLADGLHDKIPETKIFFTAICGNFSFEFYTVFFSIWFSY